MPLSKGESMEIATNPIILGIFAVWFVIARAVGLAAAEKNRRRWLWTVVSIFPLGPLGGPIWLATMPSAGEKATNGQLIGRSVLILLVVISQLARVGQLAMQTTTQEKASSEFGYETKTVVTQYKQMGIEEIVVCVQLASTVKEMSEKSTLNDSGDTHLFETQRDVDIFNNAMALSDELECDDRTYEFADLDKAMALIDEGRVDSIENRLLERINSIESKIANWNNAAPAMVDDSTRLDGVTLRSDYEVVTDFTLVEYQAVEVSQADLIEFFQPRLMSGACNNPDLAKLLSNGYAMIYDYSGNDGKFIGTVEIEGRCGD